MLSDFSSAIAGRGVPIKKAREMIANKLLFRIGVSLGVKQQIIPARQGAQAVLRSALRLDADSSGRAGGTYTSPIAELYVRRLDMDKQYDQAREFI